MGLQMAAAALHGTGDMVFHGFGGQPEPVGDVARAQLLAAVEQEYLATARGQLADGLQQLRILLLGGGDLEGRGRLTGHLFGQTFLAMPALPALALATAINAEMGDDLVHIGQGMFDRKAWPLP